ncbi:MAG: DUF4097 family beta strand repeat-containing protein [Bryobacterales bacterium]
MRTLLALPLAVLLLGCTLEVVADNVEGVFDKSLTVSGPVALELESRSGSVEVIGSSGDEVRVHGKIRAGWGMSREEAEKRVKALQDDPPVRLEDGVVRIGHGVAPALFDDISVSYEITIPERAKVTIQSRSGSQTVERVAGPVVLDSRSGSVHVRDIASDVEARLSSGSLTVEHVKGALTAESSSGSQTFRDIAGGVHTQSSSGSVKLEDIHGPVEVKASSGSVRVRQASAAPVKVDCSSGSIHVETATGAGYDFDIQTSSGGIGLPDDEVTLTQSDKRHKKGALRGGGPLIALQARSGGVQVR